MRAAINKKSNGKSPGQKKTNNSNSNIPPSGKKKGDGSSRAASAWRAVGEVAKNTKNRMSEHMKRLSPNTSAEDLLFPQSSSGRDRGRSLGDAPLAAGSGASQRVRSASPNRLRCNKCEAALDACVKYFCTECKHVFCEKCSSKQKLLAIADERHKPKAQQNKLDICLECNSPSQDVFLQSPSVSSADVVRFSHPQRGTGAFATRPPPKPFAAMSFEFIDLEEINIDENLTPENVKLGNIRGGACESLSLEDLLAGIDEIVTPVKQQQQLQQQLQQQRQRQASLSLRADMHHICSIDDTSTHSDASRSSSRIIKTNPEDTFVLFSPSDADSEANPVLNAFKYSSSPVTKAVSAELRAGPSATARSDLESCAAEEITRSAAESAPECGDASGRREDEAPRTEPAAVGSPATAPAESPEAPPALPAPSPSADLAGDAGGKAPAADMSTIVEAARSPGCDTSGEAYSEASPPGKGYEAAGGAAQLSLIQEEEGDATVAPELLEADLEELSPVLSQGWAAASQSLFISPPWSAASKHGGLRSAVKTAASSNSSVDSKWKGPFLVSPAMHSLEYSAASSLSSEWSRPKTGGKSKKGSATHDMSPAAVYGRDEFESILEERSASKLSILSGDDGDVDAVEDERARTPHAALFKGVEFSSPPWIIDGAGAFGRDDSTLHESSTSSRHNSNISTDSSSSRTSSRRACAPTGQCRALAAVLVVCVLLAAVVQYTSRGLNTSAVQAACSLHPILCNNAYWSVGPAADRSGAVCLANDRNSSCHPSFSSYNADNAMHYKGNIIEVPPVDSARVMTFTLTTTATGQQRLSIQKNAQEMQPFSALRAVLSPVSSLAAAPRALLSTVWETFREAMQQEVLID